MVHSSRTHRHLLFGQTTTRFARHVFSHVFRDLSGRSAVSAIFISPSVVDASLVIEKLTIELEFAGGLFWTSLDVRV